MGTLFDIEYIVKNIYELVKKVIQYKDSTVKKKKYPNNGIKTYLCRVYSLTHCNNDFLKNMFSVKTQTQKNKTAIGQKRFLFE